MTLPGISITLDVTPQDGPEARLVLDGGNAHLELPTGRIRLSDRLAPVHGEDIPAPLRAELAQVASMFGIVDEPRCSSCGAVGRTYCKGMCRRCYARAGYRRHAEDMDKVCRRCSKRCPTLRRGMCYACYRRWRQERAEDRPCASCGKVKLLECKGMCHACYMRSRPKAVCVSCLRERVIKARGLCDSCYHREWKIEHESRPTDGTGNGLREPDNARLSQA